MKHIIQFTISQGDKYYTASGVDFPVVTQGKTLDELVQNIEEAVALQLEGEDAKEYGFIPHPSVLVNFELEQKKVYT